MNKLILISFLLVCVGYALAGYGAGTPGYYDPWTYYGGYDRYNRRSSYQRARPYYPISSGSMSGGGGGGGSRRPQPRPYNPVSRYVSGGNGPYESRQMNPSQYGRSYNKVRYDEDAMYDYDY